MELRRHSLDDGGHMGVGYDSQGRLESDIERQLRDVQMGLAGTGHPVHGQAHLYKFDVNQENGPTLTFVGLWIPPDQKPAAELALTARGFTILDRV